jgi:hypothetical protein
MYDIGYKGDAALAMSSTERFREKVRAFLECWDYPPSTFGRKAANDPSFAHRLLRTDRSVSLATVDKVEAWIDHQMAEMDATLLEMRLSRRPRSWAFIGEALGVDPSAAKRRFALLQPTAATAKRTPRRAAKKASDPEQQLPAGEQV